MLIYNYYMISRQNDTHMYPMSFLQFLSTKSNNIKPWPAQGCSKTQLVLVSHNVIEPGVVELGRKQYYHVANISSPTKKKPPHSLHLPKLYLEAIVEDTCWKYPAIGLNPKTFLLVSPSMMLHLTPPMSPLISTELLSRLSPFFKILPYKFFYSPFRLLLCLIPQTHSNSFDSTLFLSSYSLISSFLFVC